MNLATGTTSASAPSAPVGQPDMPLCLPSLLGELNTWLEQQLALPPPVGAALALQVLSAALGPAAHLVVGDSLSIPAGLNSLMIAPPGSASSLARRMLMAPLLAIQGDLWELAGNEPDHVVKLPVSSASPEDRACHKPVILATSPAFMELQPSLARSFDGTVLTIQDAGGWELFWPDLQADRNGSRLQLFLRLLAGCSRVPPHGMPVREVITLCAEVRPQFPAWQEFIAALPPGLAARFLAVDLGSTPVAWSAAETLPVPLAERWSALVRRIFARRGEGASPVYMSESTRGLFQQFHQQLLTQVVDKPVAEQELMLAWPTLARRIALVLQQAEEDVDQPLQPAHALTGIALTLQYGAQMQVWRGRAGQELLAARQLEDRQRVVARLKRRGELSFRELCRSFNNQSSARWAPVLEQLVEEGLVVELPDGRFSLAEHQLRRLVTL